MLVDYKAMLVKSRKFFTFMILVSDSNEFKFVGECILANGARYLIDLSKCTKTQFFDRRTRRVHDGLIFHGNELVPLDCRVTNVNRKSFDDHPLRDEIDLMMRENVNRDLKEVKRE